MRRNNAAAYLLGTVGTCVLIAATANAQTAQPVAWVNVANAVITVLKNSNVPAKKIPTTGQDATPDGMANVLTGYQCGSVYKAVYQEAQDAVALATLLRAGLTPPSDLLNSTTKPPSGTTGTEQPASLLTPVWVTVANMKDTVIKDNFVDKNALCTAAGAAACTAAGIS